jgi:hypothetical protein
LPYFLGAQGADDMRRREQLTDKRRELRRLNQRLRAAEAERSAGLDRAGSLISESVDVGLLADRPEPADLADARRILRRVLDNPAAAAHAVAAGGEFERLRTRRSGLTAHLRDLAEQVRALEQYADADQSQTSELAEQHARLRTEQEVQHLAEALGSDAVRSRTTSLLRTVSRQMTAWAQALGLEHSADGAQIDLDRLTIVADTPQGPAYMDRGEIGSGMNWVGYHLTAYLALQQFFIEHDRPVPSFIVLDQPSQAFFPRDRESGGDLSELADTDRENTRRLYELTHQVVGELGGRLQVVALDHADFEDPWFAESVVQRWRGGEALIPPQWTQ